MNDKNMVSQQDPCSTAFDSWYASQSHQLTNEQVCRLIWQRGWQAALEEAAKAAECTEIATCGYWYDLRDDGYETRDNIVEAIRALKSSSLPTVAAGLSKEDRE